MAEVEPLQQDRRWRKSGVFGLGPYHTYTQGLVSRRVIRAACVSNTISAIRRLGCTLGQWRLAPGPIAQSDWYEVSSSWPDTPLDEYSLNAVEPRVYNKSIGDSTGTSDHCHRP